MDREIAPEVRQRRITRRVVAVIVAIAAIAFVFAASLQWLRPSVDRRDLRMARVERGAVEATLQASGTIVPLVEQVVSSPVEARVLRIGRRAGERVKAGDELVALDTAGSQLDAALLMERVAQKESETAQLRLRLDETIASLGAQIEQRKLDAEILHYTADQKRTLAKEGLTPEQDARAAATAAKKSDIEVRQLEEQLGRTRRANAAQLSAAERDLAIARREEGEARRQLALAMMKADRDGVLTWMIPEAGATVRRGDVLARIADLSSYRVVATISDIHAARLSAGMKARVKLDDASVSGTIDSVDPRIENGVVRFYVTLDEPSHPKLRNNLRADVFVVAGHKADSLVVRRGTLGRIDPNHAWVVRDDSVVRIPVQFGIGGDESIEILEGAAEGDELVINDMTQYRDIESLRLKGTTK
ncbi:MAG TPA: HlyD family efflux transporter periplasmic adaptor subunit [Thermoanaerobaculia bacterium]|nr:HlyD family efflux transporter periplasmic adaptor subunit [Thermoanaerobaculia bacterium]